MFLAGLNVSPTLIGVGDDGIMITSTSAGTRAGVERGGLAAEIGVRIDVVPDDPGTGCGRASSAPD